MGTIRLIRRQKASEAVGTPGLDFSTAQTFAGLARTTAGIAQQIEKNKAVTNQVDALKEAQITDEEIQKGIGEIQARANADSSISIADSIKEQISFINEVKSRRLSEVSDNKVRNLVALKHEQIKIQRTNTINKWGLKLQGINHLTKGTEIVNGLATQAERTPSFNEFENLLQQGEEIARFTATGLNAKQGAQFIKDTPESIARGYLNGRIKQDPEQGLEEFQSEGVFNTIFDSKERQKIEEDFIKAKEGKNIQTNYNATQELASSFAPFIEDPTKLNDVSFLNNMKDNFELAGQLDEKRERLFNTQIDSVLKENKLSAARDTKTLENLTVEFKRMGIKPNGEVKEDIENFNDVIDFSLRLGQAHADGKINETQYKGMAIPLQIALENAASEKQQDEGFIKRIGRAFGNEMLSQLTGGLFKGFDFQKNPVNFGISEVDNFLAPLELSEDRASIIRGSMIADLFTEIERDRNNGIQITNDSVRANLKKINKENAQRFDLPVISEESEVFRWNTETKRIEKQQVDGSWSVFK